MKLNLTSPTTLLLHIFILVVITTTQVLAADLPIRSLTPGAIDPRITEENIQSTVCIKGYTKRVRPPAHYTNKLKKRQIREYGYSDTNPKHYEEDHLIPLSIGGNPTAPENLWPEPRQSEWNAARKDDLEFTLYKMVCHNKVGLKQAQYEIASDWIAAYKKYVPVGKGRRHGRRFGQAD
ncbi:hypothetical protein GALL_88230 [mine drainage metagenome]|uniref:Uncharacterized protein n=1 Tax=mine drainage metagenome TaxID=410659 RepID=A0A1J5T9L2_9ZZZZ